MLGGTLFALDGSKVPSSASKEWSGKISELKRKRKKIENQVKRLLEQQMEAGRKGGDEGEAAKLQF